MGLFLKEKKNSVLKPKKYSTVFDLTLKAPKMKQLNLQTAQNKIRPLIMSHLSGSTLLALYSLNSQYNISGTKHFLNFAAAKFVVCILVPKGSIYEYLICQK